MNRFYIAILFSIFIVTSGTLFSQDRDELYRAKYHFTSQNNIVNAPIDIVKSNGKYHLFYQYNPNDNMNGYFHMGHAVSNDLINWKELPIALYPDKDSKEIIDCTIGEGSIIIDQNNLLKKQKGDLKTLVLFYTSINCGQCMAYSTDEGNTWEKYDKNPIIPHSAVDKAKAPKVFWHNDSGQYLMVLSRRADANEKTDGISIYKSKNLIDWEYTNHIYGISGSPNLFEIKVDSTETKKWVLMVEDGGYIVGDFDGKNFMINSKLVKIDYGVHFGNPKIFKVDDQIYQIALFKDGKYPFMPFAGQFTFPTKLSLNKKNDTYILTRTPIEALSNYYQKSYDWDDKLLIPGLKKNLVKKVKGESLRITGTFDLRSSDLFGFVVREDKKNGGTDISYDVKKGLLMLFGRGVKLEPIDNKIKLDILLDRASIEVFANDGIVSLSHNFQPEKGANRVKLITRGGELYVEKLSIHKIKSAFQ